MVDRSPRVRALANGHAVSGMIAAKVSLSSNASAGSFTATVALGDPQDPGISFWSAETDIVLDIQFSMDGGQTYATIIEGRADTIAYSPLLGIFDIEGRDFTASLISTSSQETFVNQTSSEIVSAIAQRHGLSPQVDPTSRLIGAFDTSGRICLTLNQYSALMTDWDLLTALSRIEQYDLFVQGQALFFQARQTTQRRTLSVSPNQMFDLRLERIPTLGAGFDVMVKSWNCWQQQAILASARSSVATQEGWSSSPSSQPTASFVITQPNLTLVDADTIAQLKLAEIGIHERIADFQFPGELLLTPRDLIYLYGTDTDFDQTYFIDTIEREIGPNTGFVEHIRARNSSQ